MKQNQNNIQIEMQNVMLQQIQRRGQNGISSNELMINLKLGESEFQNQLRDLMERQIIESETSGGKQYFKYTDQKEVVHLSQTEKELRTKEHGIDLFKTYKCIFKNKGKGIEKKEIQNITNIFSTKMTSLLKILEKGRYIEAVKSQKIKTKRKLFISTFFDFDENTQQGVLFQQGECDKELLEQLTNELKQKLANKPLINKEELCQQIKLTSSEHLEDQDIEKLLNIWYFDEIIEKVILGDKVWFKLSNWDTVENSAVDHPALSKFPCGNCPVRSECNPNPGSKISPYNCIYFQHIADW